MYFKGIKKQLWFSKCKIIVCVSYWEICQGGKIIFNFQNLYIDIVNKYIIYMKAMSNDERNPTAKKRKKYRFLLDDVLYLSPISRQ